VLVPLISARITSTKRSLVMLMPPAFRHRQRAVDGLRRGWGAGVGVAAKAVALSTRADEAGGRSGHPGAASAALARSLERPAPSVLRLNEILTKARRRDKPASG